MKRSVADLSRGLNASKAPRDSSQGRFPYLRDLAASSRTVSTFSLTTSSALLSFRIPRKTLDSYTGRGGQTPRTPRGSAVSIIGLGCALAAYAFQVAKADDYFILSASTGLILGLHASRCGWPNRSRFTALARRPGEPKKLFCYDPAVSANGPFQLKAGPESRQKNTN